MIHRQQIKLLVSASCELVCLIGAADFSADTGQAVLSAYNKAKSRLSSSEVASKLNLSDAELPLFEASLRDFAKRFDAIESDDPDRTTVISALRLASWLETLQSRGVAITIPDFSGLPVDEDVGRKQIRALELILRSLVSERFGGDLEQQLKAIIKPELVDKWKASGDPDDLLSGTTFSELASLVVNKDEFSHYEKLYSHSAYLNYLRDRRKTVQNFLDDVRRVRNVLAHNKSISDAQLQLLELYYEELTSPIQDAFDNGETSVDPSAYLEVSREELQSYFIDLKEDIASVQDELADFRASVEGDLGVIKEDTAVIRETTAGVKSRTTMIAAGVIALLVLVGGSYFFLVGTQENTEAILVDTASIRQTTTATNQAITEVQQSSRRIEGSLDSMQQGFDTLSQLGGVIANPSNPAEYYHNSRIFRQRGETDRALNSLRELFDFDFLFADPVRDLVALLRQRYGDEGILLAIDSFIAPEKVVLNSYAKLLVRQPLSQELEYWLSLDPFFLPAVPEIVRHSKDQDFNLTRYLLQTKLEQKFMQSASSRESFYLDPVWADQSFELVKTSFDKTDWMFFNNVNAAPIYFLAKGSPNVFKSADAGRSYQTGLVEFWPVLLDTAVNNNSFEMRFTLGGDFKDSVGLFDKSIGDWNVFYSWNGSAINSNTKSVIGKFLVVEYSDTLFPQSKITFPFTSDRPDERAGSFVCASWIYNGRIAFDIRWTDSEGRERTVTDLELCPDLERPQEFVTFKKVDQSSASEDADTQIYKLRVEDLINIHVPYATAMVIDDIQIIDIESGMSYDREAETSPKVSIRPSDFAMGLNCGFVNRCNTINDFKNSEWSVETSLNAFKIKFSVWPIRSSRMEDQNAKFRDEPLIYESNVIFR